MFCALQIGLGGVFVSLQHKHINSLEDLNIPDRYKKFILELINNLSGNDYISRIILFGSCARGELRDFSDIDIAIITKSELDEDTELSFYKYLPMGDNYIPCDLIIMSEDKYNKYKHDITMLQLHLEREGIVLNGLL